MFRGQLLLLLVGHLFWFTVCPHSLYWNRVPYAPAPIINNHATVQLRLAAAALTPCLHAACVLRALQPCICMSAL